MVNSLGHNRLPDQNPAGDSCGVAIFRQDSAGQSRLQKVADVLWVWSAIAFH